MIRSRTVSSLETLQLPCIPERREEEFERFRGNFDSTKSSSTFSEQGFEICPWLKLAERGKESVKPLSVPGSHEFLWSSGGLRWNTRGNSAKYPQKNAKKGTNPSLTVSFTRLYR